MDCEEASLIPPLSWSTEGIPVKYHDCQPIAVHARPISPDIPFKRVLDKTSLLRAMVEELKLTAEQYLHE